MQYPFIWCPGYENSLLGKTLYLSLLFQWSKNVQVTFLVCPSNVVDFWWVVIVTEFNIVTTRPRPPWMIVNWPHYIVNFNMSITWFVTLKFIVLYLFPPSILIVFVIFITITNALVSFYLQFQCVYNLHREKLCFFCWWYYLKRDWNVHFLQGYFSMSPISPTPSSLYMCPED